MLDCCVFVVVLYCQIKSIYKRKKKKRLPCLVPFLLAAAPIIRIIRLMTGAPLTEGNISLPPTRSFNGELLLKRQIQPVEGVVSS